MSEPRWLQAGGHRDTFLQSRSEPACVCIMKVVKSEELIRQMQLHRLAKAGVKVFQVEETSVDELQIFLDNYPNHVDKHLIGDLEDIRDIFSGGEEVKFETAKKILTWAPKMVAFVLGCKWHSNLKLGSSREQVSVGCGGIIMHNVLGAFLSPVVMDIKLGKVLCNPDDPWLSQEKVLRMQEHAVSRKFERFGFGITASKICMVRGSESFVKEKYEDLSKTECSGVINRGVSCLFESDEDQLHALEAFFMGRVWRRGADNGRRMAFRRVVSCIERLILLKEITQRPRGYELYSSSLLFCYEDALEVESGDCFLYLIDFRHLHLGFARVLDGVDEGVENLVRLLCLLRARLETV